ncbi:MAG: DNA phosphorothioation-dependent restriction protein DptH [Gammaproteobacteria bacterium]|nr:DNA phosphorothioation-dependent restriction protein DptH [Gammaproteobacteria bacterium]MCF6259258.1 DNA phosphorothioation-dependent restriction protein DptH [Gammaproteobacteria bacterium]
MSVERFEEFLATQFVDWAIDNAQPGFRYQFRSPNSENGRRLHASIIKNSTATVTVGEISIPYIKCRDAKLLAVLHSENNFGTTGYTENYISFLRDKVAAQQGEFNGCAMLIVHNSLLDTLVNSAEDMAQLGSVWHPLEIKIALKGLIDTRDNGREVSEGLLDNQFNIIVEDDSTMFGFEALYDAVNDGDILFSELGMFDDPMLFEMNDKPEQIRRHLDENKKLYDRISSVVENYPEELVEKLPDLSEKFVKQYFLSEEKNAWKYVKYADIRREQDRNREQKLELEFESSIQGEMIARAKSDTKAGQRNRHHLIVVDEGSTEFDIEVTFVGGAIDNNEIRITPDKGQGCFPVAHLTRGPKRSKIIITGDIVNTPLFFRFDINREKTSEKYQFHCLVIREGKFCIDSFRNNFLIDVRHKRVVLQTEESELMLNPELSTKYSLAESGQVVELSEIGLLDFSRMMNESDEVRFSLKNTDVILDFLVEGCVASEALFLPLLLDKERSIHLFSDDYFGVFNRAKSKVIIDNKEVSPKGRRLTLLQREYDLVAGHFLYLTDDGESIRVGDLKSSASSLDEAYQRLFSSLGEARTLVSLVSWGSEFIKIVTDLIDAYEAALRSIPKNELLHNDHKKLLKIGLWEQGGSRWISPIHPIILSYYLYLAKQIKENGQETFSTLPDVTIRRLNPQGLIPFLYHSRYDFTFSSTERDNCLWIQLVPQDETSYDFVRKLVKDKVSEFRGSFSSLFEGNSQSPLIINSINNGGNNELFFGLVDFIQSQEDKSPSIHVNLYDNELGYCEFDYFSETLSYDEIKSHYGLDKGKSRENADSVIDLLRTRLTYSKFTTSEVSQAYAHLSFFRNNEKVEIMQVDVDEEESGIVCHGLISGEASYAKQQSYVTGFGLKGVGYCDKKHLVIAKLFSTLFHPAQRSNTPYRESSAISLAVNDSFKGLLERSYDSSIWTTIIDPKVTLDFFETCKDVVLIHYSDQYTNSASYDAITVSRQTDLYRKVLEKDEGGIVGELNAFNGEWLLKMITSNPKIRKERKGILGAYKFVSCMLKDSGITWIPLSIGEIIRVSGNIGLKITDSDFSRQTHGYKSGAISDDVLFVGFKGKQIFLLPLEVKTGRRPDYRKAVSQSKELKRYLTEDILGGDGLANHLYRGLFIRQILIQIDKYQLYDVYREDYFKRLLENKEWWLQGDYSISELSNYPKGLVLAHVENASCFEPSFKEEDSILKIELPLSLLANLVSTPLQSLMTDKPPEALRFSPLEYILKMESAKGCIEAAISPSITIFNEEKGSDEKNTLVDEDEVVVSFGGDATESLKVLVGHDVLKQQAIYWEPTNTKKYMNPNAGIIGTMGTGKTQCTKAIVSQISKNQHKNVEGKPIGILIFDYKSDYVDEEFCKTTNAKKYQLYKLPYNPLSLYGDTPVLPVHTARGFAETMSKAFGLGQKQQLRLRKLIGEAYELAGIRKSDSSTWTKTAPTISDIWHLFLDQEKVEEDSLYAALESLYEMEVFEDKADEVTSLYELMDGVTVIELAGYPREIQNLIVALTLDLFYSQMQKHGKPKVYGDFRQLTKLVLVDEADNFMSQNFSSLRKILKEGREYGVGVILSTQDITHFKTGENDYSAYILSWVVHRVSQLKNQDIKALFNVDDRREQEVLMNTIRGLEKHHSLYVDGDKVVAKIKDKAFWELQRDS